VAGSTSLRELHLQSCKNMEAIGLEQIVRSLKEVGAWDTLDRIVIEGCDLLDYETAAEIIGRERLHFAA